ncbi:MAG: hypothetical protein ACJ75J_03940 [Cytophagaceae bacterium]
MDYLSQVELLRSYNEMLRQRMERIKFRMGIISDRLEKVKAIRSGNKNQ